MDTPTSTPAPAAPPQQSTQSRPVNEVRPMPPSQSGAPARGESSASAQSKEGEPSRTEAPAAESKPDHTSAWRTFADGFGKTLKVRGEEVPLSKLTPEQMYHYASKGFGAEKLIEEGKRQSFEAQQILKLKQAISGDDEDAALEALQQLAGPKASKVAEKLLYRELQQEERFKGVPEPVQEILKANEALQNQLREMQMHQQRAVQAERQRLEQMEVQRIQAEVHQTATKVLEAMKVPPDLAPSVMPRIARAMRINGQLEVPLSPEQLMVSVQEEMQSEMGQTMDSMSDDALLDLLTEKRVARLSKRWLERLNAPQASAQPAQPPQQRSGPKDPTYGTPAFFSNPPRR